MIATEGSVSRPDLAPVCPGKHLGQFLPHAALLPASEVVVDGLPGRKVDGQRAPAAALPGHVKDRIHHRALLILAGIAARIRPPHKGLNGSPLRVAQITGIGLFSHSPHRSTASNKSANALTQQLLRSCLVNEEASRSLSA